VRGRLADQLHATQQRVLDLSARANEPFPHRDELAATTNKLNTRRAELTTEPEPTPSPSTTLARHEPPSVGLEQ
jgi:hypothetical protein